MDLTIGCFTICHKNCYTLVDMSCEEASNLGACKPFFFMAADIAERDRWINGLQALRKAVKDNEPTETQGK